MARAPTTRTKRVSRAEACERLGIGSVTFWQRWHPVFTELRPPDQRKRFSRQVLEDELDIAVVSGAAAVLNFRRLMKRL